MSIKTTKRLALGVIAALVFAPFAAIAPASAVTASVTATVGPVRVSTTAGVQDAVPAASFAFTLPATLAGSALTDAGTSAALTVVTAPSATADVTVVVNGGTLTDDVAAAPTADVAAAGFTTDFAQNTTFTGTIAVTGTASGTYAGTLVLTDTTASNGDVITVNWSFTTTGAPASISLSPTLVSLPALADAADPNGAFTASKAVTVSLLDAAGKVTQAGSGDSILAAIPSNDNIGFTDSDDPASLTISSSDLSDGKHDVVIGSKTTTADTETITFTPQGVLSSLGVTAKTLVATTIGFGVETAVKSALTSPTATNLVAAGTKAGTENAYKVDTSVTSLVFTVTGYTPGAAYKIAVANVTGTPSFTAKDDTSNTTATASNANEKILYGVAGASGSVVVTVVMTSPADTNAIGIRSANAASVSTGGDAARVTYATATYAATVTTPAVTPTLAVTAAPIAMAGKVADTYGNPVSGAVVTVTGAITSTVATDTNITATATTAADGSWSLTMPATTAATTVVILTAVPVKSGLSISSASAVTVNFNATGSPATLTWSDGLASNEDSAAGTTLDPVTGYPAAIVPFTGSVTGNSDEVYDIATKTAGDLDATDGCVALTPTTSPAAQVVFTGSAGVKFTTTTCGTTQTLASLKDTVTVASTTPVYAVVTKTGTNTVTMKSGTVTKTAQIWGYNVLAAASARDAIRNLSADKASLSLKPGEFAVITIAAKDAFGNAVKSAAAGANAVVTVTAAGTALVEGPTLSKQYTTTDANGNIMVGVVASQTPGAGTITITGTGAQLGAAVGAATGTTAGTNGLTASAATVTVAVTVVAPVVEIVYDKPTLSFVKDGGRIILSGTAVDGEGDIIIYTKRVGTTAWKERAKTLEVAAPGDYNGSIKALKNNVVIRVKQEGTGLFSNQIIVLK